MFVHFVLSNVAYSMFEIPFDRGHSTISDFYGAQKGLIKIFEPTCGVEFEMNIEKDCLTMMSCVLL